ncbi:MAG: hypothetical protein Q8Q73_12115 [Stagnimonas sp.]|nr:hypothetical protein [Stagnimonas sp.]
MNSGYSTSPRWVRLLAALTASIVTGTLFGAVAIGLTGEEGWSLLAQHDAPAAQAAVRPA